MQEGLTDKSAVAEHAWTKGHPIRWDATKVLQRASRTMELVMKESLSIRTKPESERFNRDNGFELPDCWIATYKKLRGGASMRTTHAHLNSREALKRARAQRRDRNQLACGHLRPRRTNKLRGSATKLHSRPEEDWSIRSKRRQDNFLCYQVV